MTTTFPVTDTANLYDLTHIHTRRAPAILHQHGDWSPEEEEEGSFQSVERTTDTTPYYDQAYE